jgi:hypothetical protein
VVFKAIQNPEGSKPHSRHSGTSRRFVEFRQAVAKPYDELAGHVRRWRRSRSDIGATALCAVCAAAGRKQERSYERRELESQPAGPHGNTSSCIA